MKLLTALGLAAALVLVGCAAPAREAERAVYAKFTSQALENLRLEVYRQASNELGGDPATTYIQSLVLKSSAYGGFVQVEIEYLDDDEPWWVQCDIYQIVNGEEAATIIVGHPVDGCYGPIRNDPLW